MTIIASSVNSMIDTAFPAYYAESPYKPTRSGTSTDHLMINALANAFKEVLGAENILVGAYCAASTAGKIGYSIIANCGSYRIVIGYCLGYNGTPFKAGITFDNPTFTKYCGDGTADFGDHIIYKSFSYSKGTPNYWYTGLKCQVIKDDEMNVIYLLCKTTNADDSSSLCYAFGSFGVDNMCFGLSLTASGIDSTDFDPNSGSTFKPNCVSLKKVGDVVTTHNDAFWPMYGFERAKTKGALSGSDSTAKRYVSGMCIWGDIDVVEQTSERPLRTIIPPNKLGRISTFSTIQRGAMFNNFRNIVAIDNVLIPWTGDPDQAFIV